MSAEHWQTFQKQQHQSFKESAMPIDAIEFERQRKRQDGMCTFKSLVCCLSVLVGMPGNKNNSSKNSKRQSLQNVGVVRSFETDDASFGYNFDDQMSPRVMTRLSSTTGHNFD